MLARHPRRDAVRPILLGALYVFGGLLVLGCDNDKPSATAERPAKNEVATPADNPPPSKPTTEAKPKPPAPDKPADASAKPAGVTQANLDRFIPAELLGLKRFDTGQDMSVTEGPLIAHGAYLDKTGKEERFVNVNVAEVIDLEFEKAQFEVGKGEAKEDGNVVGKEIDGRLVQRRFYGTPPKSEANVLLVDRIVVRVSVEKAEQPDAALDYLEALDLAGLEGLVR